MVDTPGLHDLKMAKLAAEQIKEALKRAKRARLIFVVRENDRRIDPSDVLTIQSVLDSIDLDESAKQGNFGIIFNKISPKIFKMMHSTKDGGIEGARMRQEMLAAVNTGKYKTNTCLFLKRMDDLESEENALLDPEDKDSVEIRNQLSNFCLLVRDLELPNVGEIESGTLQERTDKLKAQMDQDLVELKNKTDAEMLNMQSDFEEKQKQRQAEMDAQLEAMAEKQAQQLKDLQKDAAERQAKMEAQRAEDEEKFQQQMAKNKLEQEEKLKEMEQRRREAEEKHQAEQQEANRKSAAEAKRCQEEFEKRMEEEQRQNEQQVREFQEEQRRQEQRRDDEIAAQKRDFERQLEAARQPPKKGLLSALFTSPGDTRRRYFR